MRNSSCSKCGKVLTNRRMHARHTTSCVHGKKVECPDCGKQYASTQGLKQHQKAKHGADTPDEGTYVCLYCAKQYHIKRVGLSISPAKQYHIKELG